MIEADGFTCPGLRIRPFESADLPAMQRLRQAAFKPIFQSFRALLGEEVHALAFARAESEQAELLTKLCGPDSGHRMFVAMIGDEVIGFVCFSIDAEKRTGEIGLNAVHPDHAGQGIGTALYEFATDQMKQSGMALATVGTGGDASHLPAQNAYRKAGFGPALPSLWMYKVL
jgi:ribosomal protein S18 acetylase RimI-like enzyme